MLATALMTLLRDGFISLEAPEWGCLPRRQPYHGSALLAAEAGRDMEHSPDGKATPEQVVAVTGSDTGRFLAPLLPKATVRRAAR